MIREFCRIGNDGLGRNGLLRRSHNERIVDILYAPNIAGDLDRIFPCGWSRCLAGEGDDAARDAHIREGQIGGRKRRRRALPQISFDKLRIGLSRIEGDRA